MRQIEWAVMVCKWQSLEVDYETTTVGLKRVENHRTDRYHLRIDQLKAVIAQRHGIVDQADEVRN